MSNDKKVSFEIDSRLDCVSFIGTSIKALCLDHSMDEMDSYQVQTAVTEAINNAVLHAYQNQPGYKIKVNFLLEDKSIRIEVIDEGKQLETMPPDVEPSPEAESGRGWWIMRRWMDQVNYTSAGGINCLVLLRKFESLI